jgi:ABC-type polar amino acid transport system ATPase subunit
MTPALLQVEGLALRRGARTVLASVSFAAGRGELVALMGPSGSGKTTVLRVLAGLESFHAGRISIDGIALQAGQRAQPAALAQLQRRVAMVFQFHCLFEHLPAIQNVWLAPVHVQHVAREVAASRARALLASLGVEHRADALPRELSGGEAQRVAIARAVAVDPQVLLLDEPTASLDPARRTELGELLRRLVSDGRTLVMATHDAEFAGAFASRIVHLENGVVTSETGGIEI